MAVAVAVDDLRLRLLLLLLLLLAHHCLHLLLLLGAQTQLQGHLGAADAALLAQTGALVLILVLVQTEA